MIQTHSIPVNFHPDSFLSPIALIVVIIIVIPPIPHFNLRSSLGPVRITFDDNAPLRLDDHAGVAITLLPTGFDDHPRAVMFDGAGGAVRVIAVGRDFHNGSGFLVDVRSPVLPSDRHHHIGMVMTVAVEFDLKKRAFPADLDFARVDADNGRMTPVLHEIDAGRTGVHLDMDIRSVGPEIKA
jgi:hypothetical protein